MNNKLVKDYIEMNDNKLVVGLLRGRRTIPVESSNGVLRCGDTEIQYDNTVSVRKNIDKLCKKTINDLMKTNVKVLSYCIV